MKKKWTDWEWIWTSGMGNRSTRKGLYKMGSSNGIRTLHWCSMDYVQARRCSFSYRTFFLFWLNLQHKRFCFATENYVRVLDRISTKPVWFSGFSLITIDSGLKKWFEAFVLVGYLVWFQIWIFGIKYNHINLGSVTSLDWLDFDYSLLNSLFFFFFSTMLNSL